MPKLSQNNELPIAIRQLRLCSALSSCGQIGVEQAYDMTDDESLYVYDDDCLGHSDWNNNEHAVESLSKTFNAQNPNKNTLVLLPLDGCIITGKNVIKGGVCDCALLTDIELSFVEFKTNVVSIYDACILENAIKATIQLWHTYDGIICPECLKFGVNIKQKVYIDFYVVFNKDLSVTGVRADFLNIQNDFLQNKHYPLFFHNEKRFE